MPAADNAPGPEDDDGQAAEHADRAEPAAGDAARAARRPDDAAGATARAAGRPDDAAGATARAAGRPDDAAGATARAAGRPDDAAGATARAAGRPDDAAGATARAAGRPDVTAGQPAARSARDRGRSWLRVTLRTQGLVLAIILIGAFFWWRRPAFLGIDNILIMIRSMVSLAIMSLAQMLALLSGELDLAVGAVYGLAANTLAVFWLGEGLAPAPLPLWACLLITLGVLLAIGGIVAFFTTVVRIPSFIATLGMYNIAQGVEILLGQAGSFNPQYSAMPPPEGQVRFFRALGSSVLPFGIPVQVAWLAGIALIFYVVRHKVVFGLRLAAIGENPEAATAATLKVRRYKSIVFLITALASGLAGILDFSYIGAVGPASGLGLTFPVFAAVVIGGSSLSGGKGTVIGALLGSLLIAELRNGLAVLGAGTYVQLIFVGSITIGAVTLDYVTSRRQGRSIPAFRRGRGDGRADGVGEAGPTAPPPAAP